MPIYRLSAAHEQGLHIGSNRLEAIQFTSGQEKAITAMAQQRSFCVISCLETSSKDGAISSSKTLQDAIIVAGTPKEGSQSRAKSEVNY